VRETIQCLDARPGQEWSRINSGGSSLDFWNAALRSTWPSLKAQEDPGFSGEQ